MKQPSTVALPTRAPRLVRRDHLLEQIRAGLTEGNGSSGLCALVGRGGVGKSQLALDFAAWQSDEYQMTGWISAETPEAVDASIVVLARAMGLFPDDDQPDDLVAVRRSVGSWLESNDRWLLIFDNLSDPSVVADLIPSKSAGHAVATVRALEWPGVVVSVDVFRPEEAVSFLASHQQPADEGALRAVAEQLGLHPLALAQAGAFLTETKGASPERLLELVRSQNVPLVSSDEDGGLVHVKRACYTTMDRIAADAPVARDVLEAIAFLAPDALPTSALEGLWRVAEALGLLERYSLIRLDGSKVHVHRFVQQAVRERMSDRRRRHVAEGVAWLMHRHFPPWAWAKETWPLADALRPHALTSATQAQDAGAGEGVTAELLDRVGVYMRARRLSADALDVHERAVTLAERAFGSAEAGVAWIYLHRGRCERDLGLFRQARDSYRTSLERLEAAQKRGDASNADVAWPVREVAAAERELGNHRSAELLYRRSLETTESDLGEDHPDVAFSLGGLANCLRELQQLDEAERLYKRALEIRNEHDSDNYMGRAILHNGLANTLRNMAEQADPYDVGALDRAEENYLAAVDLWERGIPPAGAPDVAWAWGGLGNVALLRRDLGTARTHFERSLALREGINDSHPDLAWSLDGLGEVALLEDDLDLAAEYLERSRHLREAALGADSYYVSWSLKGLAALAERRGQQQEAAALLERANELQQAVLAAS